MRRAAPLVLLACLGVSLCSPAAAAKRQAAAATQQAPTCLVAGRGSNPCYINPALTFDAQLRGLTPSTTDRSYQTIMAQHVLCPGLSSQAACERDPALLCSWNPLSSACEPDRFAALMVPLTCPGSKAAAYLTCQRKLEPAMCKADPACTALADWKGTCFPTWLVAEAAAAKVPPQTAAEQFVIDMLRGDAAATGECPQAVLLRRLLNMCPFNATWPACPTQHCLFDIPSFVPPRTQLLSNGSSSSSAVATGPNAGGTPARSSKLTEERSSDKGGREQLTYFGVYPGPMCFLDTTRVPTMLHSLLGLSQPFLDAIASAEKQCETADEFTYDVAHRVAACGTARFDYDTTAVRGAASAVAAANQRRPSAAAAAAGAKESASRRAQQQAGRGARGSRPEVAPWQQRQQHQQPGNRRLSGASRRAAAGAGRQQL